ncbi:MAG: S8 family serine peptidase [Porphyrobacter sp.]|nr:S8 family serine peptidase [Porphyrobacter sp.]
MRRLLPPILATLASAGLVASPLSAQLQLPGVPVPAPGLPGTLGDLTRQVDAAVDGVDLAATREAQRLLRLRARAIDRLLDRNPAAIERDAAGDLARRGELLVTGAADADLAPLEAAGFRILSREEIAGLDFTVFRLGVPTGVALAKAQRLAAEIAPGLVVAPDSLHFAAGEPAASSSPSVLPAAPDARAPIDLAVGVIDGAAGASVPVSLQKGFASGAPRASDHGSAVASLLHSAGARRLMVADVYGSDPAGGNALAIAKALGWLSASGCKVVTISLVGPRNALLERAIDSARRRGVVVVAAVGNDGPAAPPAFPASYEDVLAITGVDRKGRALIEAGRALHLDYAAPGAGVYARDAKGRARAVRGTSFATPLAAARIAAAMEDGGNWLHRLDREARDLGPKGDDDTYGRGLLCGGCGQRK